jgi:hypothetical protein
VESFSIMDCLNDILAAGDCGHCLCDILELLGLMTC